MATEVDLPSKGHTVTATADVRFQITGQGTYSISFGNFNDTLYDNTAPANFTVTGGLGNDSVVNTEPGLSSIVLGAGKDTLYGSDGSTTVSMGNGNDSVSVYHETFSVTLGSGKDSFAASESSGFIGVGGKASLALSDGSYTVGLSSGGHDSVEMSVDGPSLVTGGGGHDTIVASSGFYTIQGGGGHDSVEVSDHSNAVLYGGLGHDTMVVDNHSNASIWAGVPPNDSIHGHDSVQVTDHSSAFVHGNGGFDTVIVDSSSKGTVLGGAGNDSVEVTDHSALQFQTGFLNGHDTINVSDSSKATVYGADGNDSVNVDSGTNNVKLFSGRGNDTFSFHSSSFGGIGNSELVDFSKSDILDLQDSTFTTIGNIDAHAHFVTSGSNLVVNFTSGGTTQGHMTFDGFAGKGFTSFSSMNFAGYHIVATG